MGKAAVETTKTIQTLAVVDVPHLVALKLYASGRKSELDILELLERHPDALDAVHVVCEHLQLASARSRAREGLTCAGSGPRHRFANPFRKRRHAGRVRSRRDRGHIPHARAGVGIGTYPSPNLPPPSSW